MRSLQVSVELIQPNGPTTIAQLCFLVVSTNSTNKILQRRRKIAGKRLRSCHYYISLIVPRLFLSLLQNPHRRYQESAVLVFCLHGHFKFLEGKVYFMQLLVTPIFLIVSQCHISRTGHLTLGPAFPNKIQNLGALKCQTYSWAMTHTIAESYE